MHNFDYHIHAIHVAQDQPLIASQLVLFLEGKAFLTQDLPAITQQTINYSRRCIDECDFVIMIIGDSYGELNPSGVSQLHLSYLTAKTKDKPMLILLKSDGLDKRGRQLKNFIDIVEQRGPAHLYYYQNSDDFITVLESSFDTITNEVERKAWTQLNKALSLSSRQSSLGTNSKHTNSNSFTNSSSLNSAVDTLSSNKSKHALDVRGKHGLNSLIQDGIGNNSANIDRKGAEGQSTVPFDNLYTQPMATNINSLDSTSLESTLNRPINNSAVSINRTDSDLSEASIEAIVNQSLSDEFNLADVEKYAVHVPATVLLDDITTVSYSAHAYQDGNLSDVTLTASITWRQLLKTLEKLGKQFSSDTMYRSFNDEIAQSAMHSVVKRLPNVHAVSRCRIEPRDFAWIKEQMEYNGWLKPIELYERSNREFWELTDNAINALKKGNK